MTKIEDILSTPRILVNAQIASKKKALEALSLLTADVLPDIDSQTILEGFTARERLGCTVITPGIAVPHTRIPGVKHPVGAFIRLEKSINYDCHDQQDVDILFGLVLPENDKEQHISVLSCLAECFSSPERIEQLRCAKSSDEVFNILTQINADVELK